MSIPVITSIFFVDRDQGLMAKKEEKIKKLLDEERAAREFHANPIPKGILPNRVAYPEPNSLVVGIR